MLIIFESIVNSEWFVNATIVLYFNKLNLFRQKLAMGIPIKKYFPNYQGNNTDLQSAQNFFIGKFREVVYTQLKRFTSVLVMLPMLIMREICSHSSRI